MRKVWAAGMVTVGVTLSAQQLDMAAVAKWSAAKVVHYQITGAYNNPNAATSPPTATAPPMAWMG